jgi:predicted ATPase/DNA-binding CsgD family transcriptional regulator
LESEAETLVLCPQDELWVDMEAFQEAAAIARRAKDPAAYRAAIELYSGELLPEDRYEEWAEDRRREFSETYRSLWLGLAWAYEEREDYGSALDAHRKVTRGEPTNEEAHAGLMRLHALSGRKADALRQYELLEEAISQEAGTAPSARTRALREEIASGRFPPEAAWPVGVASKEVSEPPRHNLPVPRTSFVGRGRELTEIKRTLAMTRLLTLTGTGGSGKTRLALSVATDLAGAYPDGAWLVELAGLSEPELVPQAVAGLLGLSEQPGRTLVETLADSLREQRALLILDNCEHLVDAAARLVDFLLSSCSHLKVLATSREPLSVEGEVLFSVPPLSVPTGIPSDPSVIGGHDSVRLFLERTRMRLPDFSLTRENVGAVAEVCRKLEGIPLAIELAAARMGVLAANQVAEKLEDSLGLLSAGPRTASPRQRTMRAAIGWSHGLLSEGEKQLFARLSTFSGGFTLEAAEAVCPGGAVEEGEVLDLLSGLVDKSLVVAVASGPGAPRYRMLETVRQYGCEQLEEPERVRKRHAMYYLALVEAAEPELVGAGQVAWLERLETEYDNLRAVLRWSSEGEEPEIGLRLASALWPFWYTHGHYGEGREWLEGALSKSGGSLAILRAKALSGAGVLTFLQCEYERAATLIEESLALYRDQEDKQGVASALQTLGSVARERGRYDRAVAFHEESLALQRELGNEEGIARSLDGLGFAAWLQEDHGRAEALCTEALALYRELEDAEGVAWSLVNLGATAQHQGDLERAAELLNEGLAFSRRAGYKEGVAWSLNQLGIVEQRRGNYERAAELLRESLEVHRDLGDRWRTASVLEGLASSARERGRFERAARLLGGAEALRGAIGAPLPPCERPDCERNVSALRAAMGEEAFAKARAEGHAMTPEQTVEYALEKGGEPAKYSAPQEVPSAGRYSDVLTRREQEVAVLVARGMTNRQIARELTISERTVTTHVDHILNKLGGTSRAQVAAWVVEQRLLPEVEGQG